MVSVAFFTLTVHSHSKHVDKEALFEIGGDVASNRDHRIATHDLVKRSGDGETLESRTLNSPPPSRVVIGWMKAQALAIGDFYYF